MSLGGIYVPGAGQGAPISGRPAGTPGIGGMIRPNRKTVVLARVNSAGTTRTSASVAALVVNPAARLICSLSISFEPDTVQAIGSFAAATWTATAQRIGEDGRQSQLHPIFTSQVLPQLYEVSTGVRLILLTATVTIPLTAAAAAIPGRWICEAQWEPGMPMCEEEVAALYSQTGLSVALAAPGSLAP
jgi:hypothetical protein